MLKIFKGTGPGVIAIIILTQLILWIPPFAVQMPAGGQIFERYPMPLYALLNKLLGHAYVPGVIFSVVMLALLLILLVHFNTKIFFINQRTFLPAFLYLLFTSLFPGNMILNPVLPAAILLMLGMMRIMDSYRKQGVAYDFFDAGLLISTASLFYAGMIWFGLLVIIGISILRTVCITEIMAALFGLLAPYLIVAAIYYVANLDLMLFMEHFAANLFEESGTFAYDPENIISMIFSGLVIIVGIVFLMARINGKKIKSRKTFFLLLWCLFISLVLYFASPAISVEMMWITAIPASYLMAHYLIFTGRKLIPEIILTGLIMMVLIVQVLNII